MSSVGAPAGRTRTATGFNPWGVGPWGVAVVLCFVSLTVRAQEPLPNPDLSSLESGVQERLATAREALESALENPATDPAQRARLYGHTGKVFHAHHVFEVAEVCYRNAVSASPEESLWPYLLGYLYQDTARHPQAKESFLRVLELEPEHALVKLRLAQVHLELNEIESAERLLHGIGREDGLAAPVHAALGKIAASREDFEKAAGYYQEALRMQPQAGQLHYPLAVAYRRLGQIDKAREHAALGTTAKLVVPDPILGEVGTLSVSSEMFLTTGAQALKAKRFDLAEKAFRAAIAVNPENPRAHLNLGVVLAQLDRLAEAEESVREALRISPDYYFAYFNLGDIYEARGQVDEAMGFYVRALEGDPANLKANFRLANLLMRAERYERAARHYRAAVEVAPSFVQARYLESLALIASGRTADARKALEEAVEIHPRQPALTGSLARLLATTEPRTEEDAQRALALARQLDRDSAENVETLAMALAAAGRYEEAVTAQSAVIEAMGGQGDPELVRHLEHNLERYRSGQPSDRPWAH